MRNEEKIPEHSNAGGMKNINIYKRERGEQECITRGKYLNIAMQALKKKYGSTNTPRCINDLRKKKRKKRTSKSFFER